MTVSYTMKHYVGSPLIATGAGETVEEARHDASMKLAVQQCIFGAYILQFSGYSRLDDMSEEEYAEQWLGDDD